MAPERWKHPYPSSGKDADHDASRRAYEEADPTAFSALSPEESLVHSNAVTEKKFMDVMTDGTDRFVPVGENRRPERQQAIARLVKGIVNVADIVQVPARNAYYSKVMPHERIGQGTPPDEVLADVELLHLVFGDGDRKYYPELGTQDAEHSNLRYEDGKATYFDFEDADLAGRIRLGPGKHTSASLAHLARKLSELRDHYEGEDGLRLIRSILADSPASLYQLFPYALEMNESPEKFQEGLLRRIGQAEQLVENMRGGTDGMADAA